MQEYAKMSEVSVVIHTILYYTVVNIPVGVGPIQQYSKFGKTGKNTYSIVALLFSTLVSVEHR